MTRHPVTDTFRTKVLAALAGSAFALYLFLADIVIPAAGPVSGHYNIGNELVGAVFFSFAPFAAPLSPLVAMAMYSTYAYVALLRRSRPGLILLGLHYGVAVLVTAPVYLHRSPNLMARTKLQLAQLTERPGTMLFSFGPFIVANIWYLSRILFVRSAIRT